MTRVLPGFLVPDAEGERLRFSGAEVVVRASAEPTRGAFTVIEEIDPLDTRLHVHEHEDELFYILEGDHVVRVGDDEHRVGPGDLVFGPRGVPHAQRRVTPRAGRLLVLFSPAGFERFFRDLATADAAGTLATDFNDISQRHGITWLEP